MGKKILVVEDNETLLNLESILLTNHGYSVQAVKSGDAALSAIATDMPDLVLLDVRLPGMSGFEVCKKIKSRPKTRHIPVVFLSALTSAHHIMEGELVGGDCFIAKPFKSAKVIKTMEILLH